MITRLARRALVLAGVLALAGLEGALAPERVRAEDPVVVADTTIVAAPDWPEGRDLGAPRLRVRLTEGDRTVLRSGPGEGYALVAVVPRGADYEVVAKSGDWINLRLSPTETAWVHRALCHEYEDLSGLELRPNPRLYSRTGCFLLTGYGGGYAFDRKSNSLALGTRLGYYLFDFLEVSGSVAWTRVNRPREVVESLFDLHLEAERFSMLFYQLDLRAELMPGRRMVPYVTGGVGSSLLLGRSESGVNLGAGSLLFWNKRTAMRWECRDYRFHSGVGRSRRLNNNLEFSLGTSFLL